MTFEEYQRQSRETAMYPNAGNNFVYPALGLAGESGEVIEKIKKLIRNNNVAEVSEIPEEKLRELEKEIGDTLWYLTQIATELGLDFDTIAEKNIDKIRSRKERGVLHSEGDNR